MVLILFIIAIIVFVYLFNSIQRLGDRISVLEKRLGSEQREVTTPRPVRTVVPEAPLPLGPEQVVRAEDSASPAAPAPLVASSDSRHSEEEFGGRLLGRIGIVAVVIGIAFFLKYAFDNNIINETGRIVLGVILGLLFIVVGQYVFRKYRVYGHLLIGGGIAILYLSFTAAYLFYHLISQPVAFISLILVTIGSIVLSLVNDSMTIALIGVIGGFLTPFMLSGTYDLFTMYTYITVLDIGVLGVAFSKKWMPLNIVAFFMTLIEYYVWHSAYYTPSQLGIDFCYLSIFFVIFLSVTVMRNIWRADKADGPDLLLLTLNALFYFAAASVIFNPEHHDILWIFSLVLAALYYLMAYGAYTLNNADKALGAYLSGFATVFLTMAISLKFTDSWLTLAWFVEAVVLTFVAFYFARPTMAVFALIVYVCGLIKLFFDYISASHVTPFLNQYAALFVVAIVIAYLHAYIYASKQMEIIGNKPTTISGVFLVVAQILTVFIITSEVSNSYQDTIRNAGSYDAATSLENQRNTVISVIWTAYSLALIVIGFMFRSRTFRILGLVFFFITAAKVFLDVWSLGELYRIVSSIIFGVIALAASFVYVKYRDRITGMIIEK